jgi:hypothetical protein
MSKYLVIGDVHATFTPFRKAVNYARENDLKFISVGDLNDSGTEEGPEVFALMAKMIREEGAQSIRGNHEWKLERWLNGANVKLSHGADVTAQQLTNNADFRADFKFVIDQLSYVIEVGDFVITHAGIHRDHWTGDGKEKKLQSVNLYGEVTNERFQVGDKTYPRRYYGWCEHVPAGKTVIVGHDTRPMQALPEGELLELPKPQKDPLKYVNTDGGVTWFIDTGCGKHGTLSGLIVDTVTGETQPVNFGD